MMPSREHSQPAAIKVNGSASTGSDLLASLPSVWSLDAKIEWLIADLVPLRAVTLLTAASGTGKTWLAYAIAAAVAHGQRFLDREVRQRPVLYLDGKIHSPWSNGTSTGSACPELTI